MATDEITTSVFAKTYEISEGGKIAGTTEDGGEYYSLEETVDGDQSYNAFTVGESLVYTIFTKNDSGATLVTRVPVTVTAVSSEGVVVSSPTSDSLLYLTNNEKLQPDDTVTLSTTDAFPVCFCEGTLLETATGSKAIETLKTGDQIIGSTGLRTVKWVGWRRYRSFELRSLEQRQRCAPVRIRAGALDTQSPVQDLLVSPWHHVYVDGVLVRAHDLINGLSIVQEIHRREVSYFHVELDRFDVVLAHGVYSESWADGGNRDFFQNADRATLRPEDMKRRLAPRPGFEVVRPGDDRLAIIQARINQRASAGADLVQGAKAA